MRNIGSVYGYTAIAYGNLMTGLGKLVVNEEILRSELDDHFEVLAEPIQQMMRKHKIHNAYETLKKYTRGKKVQQKDMMDLVGSLKDDIPEEDWLRLKDLCRTPQGYIGNADDMAESVGKWRKWDRK